MTRPDQIDEEKAAKYRLCQAAALIKLFKQARQREPSSIEELTDWVVTAGIDGEIDPFAVLTRDEAEAAVLNPTMVRWIGNENTDSQN